MLRSGVVKCGDWGWEGGAWVWGLGFMVVFGRRFRRRTASGDQDSGVDWHCLMWVGCLLSGMRRTVVKRFVLVKLLVNRLASSLALFTLRLCFIVQYVSKIYFDGHFIYFSVTHLSPINPIFVNKFKTKKKKTILYNRI